MRKTSESGEGKLSSIIWLAIIVAMFYAGWHVGPVYFNNYALNDKMTELGRLTRTLNSDEKILDLLMKEVRERGLGAYIKRTDFRVLTQETSRRITVEYERTEEVLPGWKRVFHFKNEVEQPLLF